MGRCPTLVSLYFSIPALHFSMSRHARSKPRNGAGRMRSVFFFNKTATTEIYTLSLHDALPIAAAKGTSLPTSTPSERIISALRPCRLRSEEHTSELQSRPHLVCRLLLEKK